MKKRRVDNKRARFDYAVEETIDAGLVLTGQEVKAFRGGRVSLSGAFVRPLGSGKGKQQELWLINAHFSGTEVPDQSRKLLLHRKEIDRFLGKINEKGLTLIPLDLHLERGRVKLTAGLARGKKQYEKRETIKKRDVEREIRRATRNSQ